MEEHDKVAVRGLLTVQRALDVMSAFTESRPEWGVTELATQLGTHKPAIHRILWTLAQGGYVVSDPRTSRYLLGPRLISLGIVAQRSAGIGIIVQPILQQLVRVTRESALFTVRDGSSYIVAGWAAGPEPLHYASTIGRSYPWYAGSTGHAIFAYVPESEIQVMARMGFATSSPRGPHSLEDVLERYDKVRLDGYSISIREVNERLGVVAAPVRDSGTVIGSISIAGVAESIEKAQVSTVEVVLQAAARLSNLLATRSTEDHKFPVAPPPT